ncbi:MAG: hypothetical protein E7243_15395 [Lacrimispora celerecrescens]|nr:hypothetical protein [Lacrimispora celerecrescens]
MAPGILPYLLLSPQPLPRILLSHLCFLPSPLALLLFLQALLPFPLALLPSPLALLPSPLALPPFLPGSHLSLPKVLLWSLLPFPAPPHPIQPFHLLRFLLHRHCPLKSPPLPNWLPAQLPMILLIKHLQKKKHCCLNSR